MDTMKAVRLHEFGEPSVLNVEEVPVPDPNVHEVLIEVKASGVNPVDWKTRRGGGATKVIDSLPVIPGWDVSGIVRDVGAGVHRFEPGDEVHGMVSFPREGGCYAEYVTAEARDLVLKPRNLSHEESATLPLASLTAWQGLFDVAHLVGGHRICIHAAAGGVGHLAVQLAKSKGAYIVGTSSRHEDFLNDLGVDEIIDYTQTDFTTEVEDVDLVFDGVGGEVLLRSMEVLRPRGVLVTIPTSLTEQQKREAEKHNVELNWFLVEPDRHQLERITELVERGLLTPHVERVYSLKEVREAHEHIESGHTRGKIVLCP